MTAALQVIRRQLHALLARLPGDGMPDSSQAAELESLLGKLQVLAGWIPGLLADSDPVRKLLKVARALPVCPEPATRYRLLAFCLCHTAESNDLVARVIAILSIQVHRADNLSNAGGRPDQAKLQVIQKALLFIGATDQSRHAQPETGNVVLDADSLDQLRFYPESLIADSLANMISGARLGLLHALAERLATSQWSLSALCTSGGIDICRQLVGLAVLGNNHAEEAWFRNLQSRLVSLHCRKNSPDRQFLEQLLEELFSMGYAKPVKREVSALAETGSNHAVRIRQDSELAAALQSDLAGFANALDKFLVSRAAYREEEKLRRQELLVLIGRMPWILHAAGLKNAGDCFTCCHEVMARYWFCRMQWPQRLVDLLEQAGSCIDGKLFSARDDICLERLQIRMLGMWPHDSPGPDTSISLGDAGTTTLGQLPALLSQSLAILQTAGEDGFSEQLFADVRTGEVMKVLALLERGAAGVQVRPVENLCGQLLEIYGLLQVSNETVPVSLLEKCHRSLVQMLDAAACWCEPAEDQGLVREISSWLENNRSRHIGNPSHDDLPGMSSALQAFAARLGKMLAIPLRLEIPPGQQVDGQFPYNAVIQAVQALLPHLLLGISARTDYGKRRYQPGITRFTLKTGHHAEMPMLILSDDSPTAMPTAVELARLAHRLPAGANLRCSLHDSIRTFTIIFAGTRDRSAAEMSVSGITH